MNFDTMLKQRKYVMIAAILGVIGMFLPWFNFGYFGSINGMHGWGFLVFLCLAGCAVIAFLGDQSKALDRTLWMVALIASAIASLFMIIWFFDVVSNGFGYMSFGFYVAFIASLTTLYCVYKYRSPSDNIKDGFDSMKRDIETRMKSPGSSSGNNSGNINPPM